MHADRTILTQNDPAAVERLHRSQVVKLNSAIVLRLYDRLLECLTGRAADVECPHRQLRSRLADRLRSNDADCFAQLHKLARGKITAIAHRANAATTLACKHRTNFQAFSAVPLNLRPNFLSMSWFALTIFFFFSTGSAIVSQLTRPIIRWPRSTTSSSPS